MATKFPTMTRPAPRFPVARTIPSPSAANHKSTIEAKKIGTMPGMMIPFDPQLTGQRCAARLGMWESVPASR